jgi:hypothetical protein
VATQSDLYTLAKSVGLSDHDAKTAAAVGMAESKGNANAHNTNAATGDDSYGYWQINMLGALGPERRQKYGLSSNEQLFDPATNARVMKGESNNGTKWLAWSAYNNGTYLQYMNNAVSDQSGTPGWLKILSPATNFIPGGNVITSTTDGIAAGVDAISKTARWVSNSENWVRVGYVAGGSVLVIAGLVMVLQSTKAGRAAMNLVPAGRVANVVKSAK